MLEQGLGYSSWTHPHNSRLDFAAKIARVSGAAQLKVAVISRQIISLGLPTRRKLYHAIPSQEIPRNKLEIQASQRPYII